jgi:hypothetical protein
MLTLAMDSDREKIELYQTKMLKSFSRPDMLKVVPIMWKELERVKSRVEDVCGAITGKVAN